MQQLLFAVVFSEMILIMVTLFKSPLRKLVIVGLDQLKRGRGPVMVKTVAGTVFVVFMSSAYSMTKIQKRRIDEGALNPTDQVLMAKHILEATLMGNQPNPTKTFILFRRFSFSTSANELAVFSYMKTVQLTESELSNLKITSKIKRSIASRDS